MGRRAIQVGVLALLAALLPLAVLGALTTAKAQQVVHREVAARLGLAASLSASLVSAPLSSAVTLVEAEARRPRMVAAVADGNPADFDLAELTQQLVAMKASRTSSTPLWWTCPGCFASPRMYRLTSGPTSAAGNTSVA